VSVVVNLRNTSILRFVCLRIFVHSRMFIRTLFSYVELSFMLSYIWFMCALMVCGLVLVVSYVIRMSSTQHVLCMKELLYVYFFVSRSCCMCTSLYQGVVLCVHLGSVVEIFWLLFLIWETPWKYLVLVGRSYV